VRLGCGQADEFCAGEGEGGCDKDVAEAFEAVVEGAWVGPVHASYVTDVLRTTAVDHYAEDSGKGQYESQEWGRGESCT
jgi:hypothetical protein